MFETQAIAGWGDMDFNAHMRNTAYLDKSADTRMLYFASAGFPMAEFMRLRLGPVVKKDEVEYFREIHLLESVRVNFLIAGLSADAGRFIACNEFHRADGKLAARVRSEVGWLDLSARKLTAPPPALRAAIEALERTGDFAVLPSGT